MITLEYDRVLVEQATFLAARRDSDRERELHAVIDPLYEIGDEDVRQRKFADAMRAFFSRFGLDSVVRGLIEECPLIRDRVVSCLVREAARQKTESADLFLNKGGTGFTVEDRTLVIEACPQSLVDPENFSSRMRRELLHVSDMLDERFGYDSKSLSGVRPHESLRRDRYRVLWDIYIEGRLGRAGRGSAKACAALRRAFERVCGGDDKEFTERAFQYVFGISCLTHDDLMNWAENPDALFRDAGTSTGARPPSGEACPLCGFPTFDWFEFADDADGVTESAIESSRPGWSRSSGACRQCAELYAAASQADRSPRRGQTPDRTPVVEHLGTCP